jgi:hypothetical protein
MDAFLLGTIGFVVVALAIYVVASIRLERSRRIHGKVSHTESTHK